MNEYITSYLDKYLALQKPDFAVMITGEWGCGKTYFINDYKRELGKAKRKYKYVSLNGVSDLDGVVSQLLTAGSRLGAVYKWVKRIGANVTVPYVSLGNIFRSEDFCGFLKENILIFDDFERCKVDKSELLGYLSQFTERQNLHVIIIGDETKISSVDNYFFQKEKVIGKTLELESSDNIILPALLDSFGVNIATIAKQHLAELGDLIRKVNVYKKESRTNYRIIKHVFQEFSFIFSSILDQPQLKKHQNFVFIALLQRFFVVSYLLQKGEVDQCFIDNFWFSVYLEENSPEYKARADFKVAFPQWDMDYFIPSEIWKDIFKNRTINQQILVEYIECRMNPQTENWCELWHYFEKTDEEIEDCLTKVSDDIARKEYKDPVQIIHVFATLLDMSKEGFIEKSHSYIVAEAKNYIDEIAPDIQYNQQVYRDRDLLQFNGSGLGVYGSETAEVKEIAEKLLIALSRKNHEFKTDLYEKLLSKFSNDTSSFKEWARSDQYYCNDIFSEQNPRLLWDAWIILNPKAFREIGLWFDSRIIEVQLLNRRELQVNFWIALVAFAKSYLEEHKRAKDEKSKCLYLERFFIPNVEKQLPSDDIK